MLEDLFRSVLIEADRRNKDVLVRAFRLSSRKEEIENDLVALYGEIMRESLITIATDEWGRIDPWSVDFE